MVTSRKGLFPRDSFAMLIRLCRCPFSTSSFSREGSLMLSTKKRAAALAIVVITKGRERSMSAT